MLASTASWSANTPQDAMEYTSYCVGVFIYSYRHPYKRGYSITTEAQPVVSHPYKWG